MGIKDCFYESEITDFSAKINCLSLEPPDFCETSVVVICVLISRHMRKKRLVRRKRTC